MWVWAGKAVCCASCCQESSVQAVSFWGLIVALTGYNVYHRGTAAFQILQLRQSWGKQSNLHHWTLKSGSPFNCLLAKYRSASQISEVQRESCFVDLWGSNPKSKHPSSGYRKGSNTLGTPLIACQVSNAKMIYKYQLSHVLIGNKPANARADGIAWGLSYME